LDNLPGRSDQNVALVATAYWSWPGSPASRASSASSGRVAGLSGTWTRVMITGVRWTTHGGLVSENDGGRRRRTRRCSRQRRCGISGSFWSSRRCS